MLRLKIFKIKQIVIDWHLKYWYLVPQDADKKPEYTSIVWLCFTVRVFYKPTNTHK